MSTAKVTRSAGSTRRRKTDALPRLYTTRINHVGALIPDTKTLLAHWDLNADVPENLARMRVENVFAKASRTRIPEVLDTFRNRYLEDPDVVAALVTLT